MVFSDETQKNIDALKKCVGHDLSCPVCQHKNFGVIEGKIVHPIQRQPNTIQIGGPAISSIMLVCQHCGYLLEFAVNILQGEEIR